ncbi:MAG: GNAT family N-acetyltransferase [Defluviitaleaceae bacterium]|nr:GNAT family N-acetyltransferase [Defluviitaleaceae bacterium]
MNIEIITAAKSHKPVLRQLIELYEYDFTEFEDNDVDEHGFFGYRYLDHYWTDEHRHPYLVKVDGKYAGFVLVNKHCYYTNDENTHTIAEFFIMRKYRRTGVGSIAARFVFDLFPGMWEVRVMSENKPALPFWRKVINEYTNGKYEYYSEPTDTWDGVGYEFTSNRRGELCSPNSTGRAISDEQSSSLR